jgi:hypothetical protein
MVTLDQDPKPPQKISSPNYFSDETEKSVIRYQDEQDAEKKNAIFSQEIRPALLKLIENVIYVYKFHILRRCRLAQE